MWCNPQSLSISGFTVKHFHEQLGKRHHYTLGYTVTKLHLHRAALVQAATKRSAHRKKRPRRPMVGMLLHRSLPRTSARVVQTAVVMLRRCADFREGEPWPAPAVSRTQSTRCCRFTVGRGSHGGHRERQSHGGPLSSAYRAPREAQVPFLGGPRWLCLSRCPPCEPLLIPPATLSAAPIAKARRGHLSAISRTQGTRSGDASTHAWLPGDARSYDLVVTMEDATSNLLGVSGGSGGHGMELSRGAGRGCAARSVLFTLFCSVHSILTGQPLLLYAGGRRAGIEDGSGAVRPCPEAARHIVDDQMPAQPQSGCVALCASSAISRRSRHSCRTPCMFAGSSARRAECSLSISAASHSRGVICFCNSAYSGP